MSIYRVRVEERRFATVYVEADSAEEAEQTAEELYDDFLEDHETDIDAYPLDLSQPVPPGELVWVGGADGDFEDLKRHLQGGTDE